jgi:hypothetical protein
LIYDLRFTIDAQTEKAAAREIYFGLRWQAERDTAFLSKRRRRCALPAHSK